MADQNLPFSNDISGGIGHNVWANVFFYYTLELKKVSPRSSYNLWCNVPKYVGLYLTVLQMLIIKFTISLIVIGLKKTPIFL